MKKLALSILGIILLSIITISVLLNPDNLDNNSFWFKVSWICFLSGLNWWASVALFSSDNKASTKFAILPSINIVVVIYSIVSAFLLFLPLLFNFETKIPFHLISQIVLAAITSLLIVFMLMSAKAAEIPTDGSAFPKNVLIEKMTRIMNKIHVPAEKNAFESALERVKYHSFHNSKLQRISQYHELCSLIESLESNFDEVTFKDDISSIESHISYCI